jgi:pimeloyl-ACP methyl ester carboxylesterase
MIRIISSFIFIAQVIHQTTYASTTKMDAVFYSKLNSQNIELLPKEHLKIYPFLALSPYNIVGLRWIPDWSADLLPADCSETQVISAVRNISTKPGSIIGLWQNCEPKIRQDSKNQFHETMSMLSYDFDPLNHPLSREVIFHLPNAITVRGLLFLRKPAPRPLVIIRPGIFSSFNSMIAERFIFSQLFERGDFHILIIPSTTGKQFIEDNDRYIFGGFEEGLHTLWIARELKKSGQPLAQFIKEIHTVGISMGAHGTLAASLFNNIQKQNWIQKSIYFCPLMNFNSTLENLKDKSIKSILTSFWTGMRLEPLRKKYSISIIEFLDYFNLVDRLTQNYKIPLMGWDDELLPAMAKSISSFTEFNDFNNWLSYKNLTNPSLLFYSLRDTLVPPESNVLAVKDQLPENVRVLPMPKGFHCSVPVNYNEAFISTLINSFLETKSDHKITANTESNSETMKTIWQLPLSYGKTDIENLRISDIQISDNENLIVEIKNRSPFSGWHSKIEVPATSIDMYFAKGIWNRHLRISLKKWLEAHSQFVNQIEGNSNKISFHIIGN